jgi:hypothetical protein
MNEKLVKISAIRVKFFNAFDLGNHSGLNYLFFSFKFVF